MRRLLVAAALVLAGTSAALAQGYVYYGAPAGYVYQYGPGHGVYYAPGYARTYGTYDYAPGYWYGASDDTDAGVWQPSPRSTIRAIR